MTKAISLKVGDPVTCMRRYYLGKPYHGTIKNIENGFICISFSDGFFYYSKHGGLSIGDPCSMIPGHIEPEQPTQPEQPTPVEPDETPKEGDWCAFWDDGNDFIVRKYNNFFAHRDSPHYDELAMYWRHARKLKPSDLSPELWAILKNEETK